MDNTVVQKISYGLFVLTANKDGKDNGCIINTVTQVTDNPNQITIAVNKLNYTHDLIAETKKFTVSIISEAANFELFKRFGFQTGKKVNKFEGFNAVKRTENGTLAITEGINSYISANVKQIIDVGTHTIFLADVIDMQKLNDTPSATYAYYHANIKPKPQSVGKNAKGETIWRCTVCGYEYDPEVGEPDSGIAPGTAFEDLPDDWCCPVCGATKDMFSKVD